MSPRTQTAKSSGRCTGASLDVHLPRDIKSPAEAGMGRSGTARALPHSHVSLAARSVRLLGQDGREPYGELRAPIAVALTGLLRAFVFGCTTQRSPVDSSPPQKVSTASRLFSPTRTRVQIGGAPDVRVVFTTIGW